MSRRDYAHREPKKAKKDTRTLPEISVSPSPINVEVVKKKKKKELEEES